MSPYKERRRLQQRPARQIAFPLLLMALAVPLSACSRSITVTRPASSCLTLIPQAVKEPTPGADLPANDTAGEWVGFGVRQTGQLGHANASKAAALEIITRCEARDAETVAALAKRKWWQR